VQIPKDKKLLHTDLLKHLDIFNKCVQAMVAVQRIYIQKPNTKYKVCALSPL